MIRVRRPTGSTPAILGKKGKGGAEMRRNLKLFAQASAGEMVFAAYRDKSVRTALDDLFGRKCVFCESMLLASQSGDIEHFRPKGRVMVHDPVTNTFAPHSGYHWLAACWHNLLIACRDCNSPRTQKDAHGVNKVFGKACFFPVTNEAHRATGPSRLRKENALLLHPCIDDPEQHLEFTDDGGIRSRTRDGMVSERGSATIKYCGLDRAELLQMRARHQRTVMASIRHIIEALEKGQEPGRDLDDLLFMLQRKEAYVGFTRHLVRTYLGPYFERLNLLL